MTDDGKKGINKITRAMKMANELIGKCELYRWVRSDEHQELFDVLTDGYLYRLEEGSSNEQVNK